MQRRTIEWYMNWEGYGRKLSQTKRVTIPSFPRKDWKPGNHEPHSGQQVSLQRFQPSTFRMQIQGITSTPTCSVTSKINSGYEVVPVLQALCHVGIWGNGSTFLPFLTSTLDEGKWSSSRPGRFNHPEIVPGTQFIGPITVAARSKPRTLFALSKAGIVCSNPTQGMNVYVWGYSVFLLSCVWVAVLRRAESYCLCKNDCGTEEEARAQQRAVEQLMNEWMN
jgi:hypothetical protein